MRKFGKFSYETVDKLKTDIEKNSLDIKLSFSREIFKRSIELNDFKIPNRLAIHPMEGCDANEDGSPGELTIRRYKRFAAGGAGLIWFEAVAIEEGGKANPRQLMLTADNVDEFKKIVSIIYDTAIEANGEENKPVVVAQLTHSGRFSRPYDKPKPIIAYHNPILNQKFMIDSDHPVITDDELESLEEKYVKTAVLAKEAGFDGVDIKACHRYLISELFSAHSRKGKYGGTFEGRTRFIRNIVRKVKRAVGDDFIITTRMNIYDGIDYPYGWGVNHEDSSKMDLEEPLKLISMLNKMGVRLINVSMGTPYFNPHINRPYDRGGYIPEENQLIAVNRLIKGAAEVQKANPDMIVVGTGYSWLRHLSVDVAAGTLENNMAKLIGFGREAFAYPNFANDILTEGYLKREKCCIACSMCTELMRAHSTPGCVIKDKEIYAKLYKEVCMK